MTFAALMMVSVSVPAVAVNPVISFAPAMASPDAIDGQQVSVGADVTIATVDRDGYITEKVPTVASYSQTAGTYVNYFGAIQWPFLTGVPISTDFGYRVAPCEGCSSYHKGIDMNPGVNSPIQSIADGVVREVSATDNGGLGVYAVIDHTIDGELVSSVYAHMAEASLALSVGQTVSVGDLVGNVGNTGQSTGPHLHFEILLDGVTPTDPFAWLSERVVP
ncbi:murein DD-endopeptidase MepM/ murein hydrolase activator NlpD [Agromyces hippuratus]|uniref:Murein DD-endopeptidase MepM/ murein hydrolase activator NlpD n=1 Tax=Agromyces hippuratus TaxID=286438 RepID=A0A852X1N5_9MICO|nr:M23 family metallopeptidase [Agromyces hippuratus]NYG20051.1 murein DD-endopeptidase MepM/ murein hydrolase activator NlpD [Agromyces hippuratus]